MSDVLTSPPAAKTGEPDGRDASPPGDRSRHTIAIVIPIYNEQEILPELCRRLTEACGAIPGAPGEPGVDWRVIFVDDGSRDETVKLVLEQHEKDGRFTLIQLSRNFGHQAAITAGVAHAHADALVIMDADLQDPPELIPQLVDAWHQGGQVVMAQRRSRAERGIRRLGFDLFHKFFGWLSDFPIPSQTGVFGLLDRAAADELRRLTERNRFIPGLRSWIGFEQKTVYYDRQERAAGAPKQTLARLARYAMDGVFSFSYKPLRLMKWAGSLIAALGFGIAIFYIFKRLLGYEKADLGYTTLLTMITVLGGVQLIAIGLLGEYLGRIYDEVKNRPLFIVKKRTGVEAPQPGDTSNGVGGIPLERDAPGQYADRA